MDNKLSELSKPVFEIEISDGYWLNCSISPLQPRDGAKFNGWPDGVNRLYSQEYVSALLEELEAKDKRIAELEAKTAMTMGVGSGNGNLFVHGDYDSIKAAQAIVLENESLRAKLATPVRLLGEMLPHEWERAERQAAFEHRKIAWDARLAEDKKAILEAGFTFTVEGDE